MCVIYARYFTNWVMSYEPSFREKPLVLFFGLGVGSEGDVHRKTGYKGSLLGGLKIRGPLIPTGSAMHLECLRLQSHRQAK